MEKLPFPGEGFHIENRRLGSLFEYRRIRPKKNPQKKKKPKKNPKKKSKKKPKKNPQKKPIHIHDTGTYVPVSDIWCRHNHDTGTLFRCPKCVPVSEIYCTTNDHIGPNVITDFIINY